MYIREPYLDSRLNASKIMKFFQNMTDPHIASSLSEDERNMMATLAEDFKVLIGEFDHTINQLIQQNRQLESNVNLQNDTINRLNLRTMELVKDVSKIEELEKSLDRLSTTILRNLKNIETVGAEDLYDSPIKPGVRVEFADGTGVIAGVAPEEQLVKVLLDSYNTVGSMHYKKKHLILPIDEVTIVP